MPIIRIDYDDKIVSENDINSLSKGLNEILVDVTKIDDCPVYPQSYALAHKIAPIEVYENYRSTLHKI